MSEIGVLSNTFLIADTVWIFGNAFGMVLHSKALNINNLNLQNRLATLYSTVSFWVTLTLIFLIFVVPEDIYSWVFGSDFSEMKDRLVLISPGILALAVSAPLGHLLHARNRFLTLLVNHSIAWMSMLVISTLFFYDLMECVLVSPFWLLIGLDVALILVLLLNLYSLQLTNYFLSRFKVNSLITLRLLKKVMHL
jgi:O-antigen/teichoic acid export membrane protein